MNTKEFLKDLPIMTFGMFIAAAAVHFFLVPSHLIIGSISGLSIVFSVLLGLPVSVITFIINGFLLIIAYFLIGKEFGVKTVYTALILSPFLALLEHFFPMQESIMGDSWLDLVCFVLLLSFSQALLFRRNASTGGLDILAKIVNKYAHIQIGTSVSIAGALICCTAFAINDLRMVIIGLIGTYLNGLVVDHFTIGFNARKKVCMITEEYEKIQKFIVNDLHRGATIYTVRGGLGNQDRCEIESIMTRNEFSYLMEYIKKEQIVTFMTASTVSEIYGNLGVKSVRKKPAVLMGK